MYKERGGGDGPTPVEAEGKKSKARLAFLEAQLGIAPTTEIEDLQVLAQASRSNIGYGETSGPETADAHPTSSSYEFPPQEQKIFSATTESNEFSMTTYPVAAAAYPTSNQDLRPHVNPITVPVSDIAFSAQIIEAPHEISSLDPLGNNQRMRQASSSATSEQSIENIGSLEEIDNQLMYQRGEAIIYHGIR
ncbi:hypothetical protein HDU93_002605, partial [Gonapodya sp. JEL0774]